MVRSNNDLAHPIDLMLRGNLCNLCLLHSVGMSAKKNKSPSTFSTTFLKHGKYTIQSGKSGKF